MHCFQGMRGGVTKLYELFLTIRHWHVFRVRMLGPLAHIKLLKTREVALVVALIMEATGGRFTPIERGEVLRLGTHCRCEIPGGIIATGWTTQIRTRNGEHTSPLDASSSLVSRLPVTGALGMATESDPAGLHPAARGGRAYQGSRPSRRRDGCHAPSHAR